MYEDTESLARRRAVEIKHGRIAMMSFLGMMVQVPLGVVFPRRASRRADTRVEARRRGGRRPSASRLDAHRL